MFPIFQRYNFESNSQQIVGSTIAYLDVSDISKIQFWKQFTTLIERTNAALEMFPIFQRYNFESNSQPCRLFRCGCGGCFRYFKDTILKAIHNKMSCAFISFLMFPIFQRYNFESNSQLQTRILTTLKRCFRYFKDTILKAIHNTWVF